MSNPIFIVTYFYPDNIFAGVIGAYSSEHRAQEEIGRLQTSYSDCKFLITVVEVDT